MFSFAVRTFVTEFKLKKMFLNTTVEKHADLREVESEITKTVSFLKGIFLLRRLFSGTDFIQNWDPPADQLCLQGCSFLF